MSPREEIVDWEIFLWALDRLGGSTHFIDVEDVSLECFKIAPARFGWRTKPELPDYKKCSKALQAAEARHPEMLVKTRDGFRRQLSAEGQKWAERNGKRLSQILTAGLPVSAPRIRPSSRMLAEIERSDPFIQWTETGTIPLEKWRVADILRCSPDSSTETWNARIESAKAVAHSARKENILRFLSEVAIAHPDWFGGLQHET